VAQTKAVWTPSMEPCVLFELCTNGVNNYGVRVLNIEMHLILSHETGKRALSFPQHLFCGAIAGSTELLCLYPLGTCSPGACAGQ
jgi:hypothetical protein